MTDIRSSRSIAQEVVDEINRGALGASDVDIVQRALEGAMLDARTDQTRLIALCPPAPVERVREGLPDYFETETSADGVISRRGDR